MRISTIALVIATSLLYSSCNSFKKETASDDATKNAQDTVADADAAANEAVSAIGKAADDATADMKSAAESATSTAAGTKGTVGDALASLPDMAALSKLLEPSAAIEELKAAIAKLDGATVTALGEKLLAAITTENGVVAGLKSQLSGLSAADRIGAKGDDLKQDVQDAETKLDGLTEKLGAIVEALKEKGAAIPSSITAQLNGEN
jgi:hypothetical protein